MKTSTIGAVGVVGAAVAAMSLSMAARRRSRRLDLRGRVAIVTGGGRGLGLAITRELVRHGASVAICSRNEEVIRRSVQELQSRGADVLGMRCDASNPEQANTFIEAVVNRYGAIDALVNNAGQCFVGPAVELQAQDMERAIRNIFWAHYHPTMAVLPHMRRRGFGRIANITSIGGKLPIPHQAAYVAAKYAATGWSQTLAVELAKEGILVSTITPPPLRNGAPLHTHFNGDAEAEFSWFGQTLTSHFTAESADLTARVIVDALIHGDRERSVSATSWLTARAFGLAPNLVSRWLTQVDARLPLASRTSSSPMRLGSEVVESSSNWELRSIADRAAAQEGHYLPQ